MESKRESIGLLETCCVVLLLLFIMPQCSGQGSGNSSDTLKPPRCLKASNQHTCSLIRRSAAYHLDIIDDIDSIIEIMKKATFVANSTDRCRRFITFLLCFYAFRDCDPSDDSQLKICLERCPLFASLFQDCGSQALVKEINNNINDSETLAFFKSVGDDTVEPSPVVSLGPAVGVPVLIILVIVVVVLCIFQLCKSKTNLKQKLFGQRSHGNVYQQNTEELREIVRETEKIQLSPEEQCYYEERFESAVIAYDQLEFAEVIGEGAFGVVCMGTLATTVGTVPVAIKTAKCLSTKEELRSLLNESLLMKRFEHPNIVGLLGVCFSTPEGYPYLILPFMVNGNIRDYLKNKRVHISNTDTLPEDLTMKNLMTLCLDIAKGMDYLSSNKFVHRDLAARNCMLDENYVVKVGDFGLARDVYSHLYYRADKHSRIPVKWAAPEMLNDGICTEKSDVWSFGVTCWEVFSLGSVPYPGITNYDIPQYVASGQRLKKPSLCSENMYAIMLSCWNQKPEERPLFKQLVSDILPLTV